MSVIRPFSDVDLHAFVDDQVSPERRAAIAGYLKAEPAEAARVESWRRQNEAIRGVFTGTASEPVPIWLTIGQLASGKERLELADIDRGPGRDSVTARAGRARWRDAGITLPWVTAFAVLLAFAAGFVSPAMLPQWSAALQRYFPGSPRSEAIQHIAGRTLEAHRIYGLDPDQPAEMVSTAAADVAAWFQRRVAFPVRIPDLRTSGWIMRGGRVVPGEIGAAAMLIYEDAVGDRLSLVISRIDNPAPFDTSFEIADGPVLAWMDGPLGFGLATSREGAWLSDHARALYRAVYQSRSE